MYFKKVYGRRLQWKAMREAFEEVSAERSLEEGKKWTKDSKRHLHVSPYRNALLQGYNRSLWDGVCIERRKTVREVVSRFMPKVFKGVCNRRYLRREAKSSREVCWEGLWLWQRAAREITKERRWRNALRWNETWSFHACSRKSSFRTPSFSTDDITESSLGNPLACESFSMRASGARGPQGPQAWPHWRSLCWRGRLFICMQPVLLENETFATAQLWHVHEFLNVEKCWMFAVPHVQESGVGVSTAFQFGFIIC